MKLEINHRKRNEKKLTTKRLNNMLLKKNQWVNEENKKEIKKYLETNGNESIVAQNLWDEPKSLSEGRL